MLKSKKAFTLIEIIVSLAIFAIISAGFYSLFATVFISTYNTSQITENSFASQSAVEDAILDVKTKLQNSDHGSITNDTKVYTLFSELGSSFEKDVTVYEVFESVEGSRPIETYVAQTRPPQLVVPNITSDVRISARTLSEQNYPNIGMKQSLTINADEPVVDNPGYLIQHLYYWYKTGGRDYIKSQPPVFPDNYAIIPEYTGKVISTVNDSYANSFIKLLVTPVGEKGQMGNSYPSNDVLISGMPVNDNLLLHLDASMVDLVADVSSNRVIRWNDVGPYSIIGSNSNTNNRPAISEYTVGSDTTHKVLGIQRNLSGANQYLRTNANSSINSKSNLTVYFVAKFDSVSSVSTNVLLLNSRHNSSTYKWLFGTNDSGQLELRKVGNNTSRVDSVALEFPEDNPDYELGFRNDEWSIIRLDIHSNRLAIYYDLVKNEDNYEYMIVNPIVPNFTYNVNSSPFEVSFNNVGYTMGEVIIFDGQQSNEDSQKVLDYLYTKYRYE